MNRNKRLCLMLAIAMSILAFAIRWRGVDKECWLDELGTAWVIKDGFAFIPARAPLSCLPPTYFFLVRIVVELFGFNETAMRLPSVIAGSMLPLAVYLLGARLTKNRLLGLLAALLVVFDPTAIHYSLENRPYACVQLVAALQVLAFWRLVEHPPSALGRPRYGAIAWFSLLTALCCNLHPTSMVILGPQILFMLILAMKEGWSALPRAAEVAGGMTLAGLLCLPLIGTFSYLFQTREVLGSWVGDAEPEKIFTRFLALRYVLAPLCLGIIAHYLLGGKFAAAAPADSTDSAEAEQNVRPLVFCLLWFIVPGAQLFLMSKAGLMNINLERYMIVAAIAPLIMLATICRCFPSWGARIATITITLVLVSPFWLEAARGTSAAFQPRHLSWREAVAYVNQECPADLPVFARSGLVEGKLLEKGTNELTKSLLLCTVNGLYALQPGSHPMIPIHDISMLSRYSAEIRQAGGCIVMGSFKADFDCENNMAKTMETIGVPLSRATITCRQDSNIVTVVVRLAKENATTENATSTPVSANSPLIK